MCWEIDYKFFAQQKKAQQTRIEQERCAGVIHHLLNEANKQGEPSNVEETRPKRPRLRNRDARPPPKRRISLIFLRRAQLKAALGACLVELAERSCFQN